MTTAMRFKPDKRLRDLFFTPESYQHPAKGIWGFGGRYWNGIPSQGRRFSIRWPAWELRYSVP